MHGPEGGTLEERFYRVCAALLLFGYTPEEIDRMIDNDIIVRPQRWNRYYGLSIGCDKWRRVSRRHNLRE